MSGKVIENEIQPFENRIGIDNSNPRKQKHNSKRRKAKKKPNNRDLDQGEVKVEEVVNFLCSSITKNECGSSTSSKASRKKTKKVNESFAENFDVSAGQNEMNEFPSTSQNELSSLFENLQVHASKNLIKPNNIAEFLNIDLLKKTNCETLSLEELERIKQEKREKLSQNSEPAVIPKEKLKEYFNLNLIKKSPDRSVIKQIESSSMKLASELETTLYQQQVEEKAQSDKYLTEYFNLNVLKNTEGNLVHSIKSSSKLLVSELEKTLLECEALENGKSDRKKDVRKSSKKAEEEAEVFDGKQKVFLNSGLAQRGSSAKKLQSPGAMTSKKRQHRHKSESCAQKEDMKFPKYLSPEELFSVSQFGVLMTGIIRINQKNYKEAYITAPDKGMDILIEGLKDRNRALEGDEVYFVLKPKEHHRPHLDSADGQRTAVIVGIKCMNHSRGAIGTVGLMQDRNMNFALFSPRDSRLPRIRIRRSNWPLGLMENPSSFKDSLFFARITHWNDLRYADGEITEEVGVAGDIEAETKALLLKYELEVTPYPRELHRFFPATPFHIPKQEIQKREDLRSECIFTIDPATARDLDDAVSCKVLSNGNFQVGVHISDVSYFLMEGTPLDKAVSRRATTVYLVQEVHHMLPRELCHMCSLTPGEDKLAFSVFWEISPQLEVVSHRFARSVINSCAQLSYEHAQAMLDGTLDENILPEIHGQHNSAQLLEIVHNMQKIAAHFRQERFKNGALKIDQTKINFRLNEEGMPQEYLVSVNKEANRLIEEFMLLANMTVAARISHCFPRLAFLRAHSEPLAFLLEKLQKNMEKFGIILDISSSGALQDSLVRYSGQDVTSLARMLVLNNTLAKPMARARYYCADLMPEEDRRHYALSVPLYTHFTSPIRRYADVMVHRLLEAAQGYADRPKWDVEDVHRTACNCNKQKYASKLAGEASTELFLAVYIAQRGSLLCEAVVCDIKDKSFDCIVLSTGAHQRVYSEHIQGRVVYEEVDGIYRVKIIWPKDADHSEEFVQVVEMFSIVAINLKRSTGLKIEARLVRNQTKTA